MGITGDEPSGRDAGFPSVGGELAALIRALDWSTTSLGPISSWPEHLKSAVNLMLPARAQIVLFWGPKFVALYNDAYAPTIGEKHPRALGRPAQESWTELWDDLEPLLRRVLETGETVFAKDRPFYIERHGYPENCWFTLSYSGMPRFIKPWTALTLKLVRPLVPFLVVSMITPFAAREPYSAVAAASFSTVTEAISSIFNASMEPS